MILPVGQPRGPLVVPPTAPAAASTIDLGGYWRGQLPSNPDPIQRIPLVRTITLRAGLAGALASAITPPVGDVTFVIRIDGASVGTINFAAGSTAGTFTFPVTQVIAEGQIFEVYPPASQDSTLSDVSWTIAGVADGEGFYDLGGYWRGQLPATTDPIQRIVLIRTVILDVGLPGSLASCVNAPTGNVSLVLKANGISIGSINFASGATAGTFVFLAPQAIWAGQTFEVFPPSPQDATFSDVSWTLMGST